MNLLAVVVLGCGGLDEVYYQSYSLNELYIEKGETMTYVPLENDIPLKPGLFHVPESSSEKPYLIGSKCSVCGYVCFPKKEVCVKCLRDDTMEETKLGPYGNLETFCIMQVGPPDFPPPYAIGYVKTKEGAKVFTQITGCEPKDDALEMGDEMEMVIEKLKKDNKGNNLIGWKFKPVKERKP
jgi:uncharacterized OB-fold protein